MLKNAPFLYCFFSLFFEFFPVKNWANFDRFFWALFSSFFESIFLLFLLGFFALFFLKNWPIFNLFLILFLSSFFTIFYMIYYLFFLHFLVFILCWFEIFSLKKVRDERLIMSSLLLKINSIKLNLLIQKNHLKTFHLGL